MLAWCLVPFTRAEVPYSAAELKAVFLFNFGTFVRWPPSRLGNASDPFRIGVYGAPEVVKALEQVVRNEKIQGHAVAVVPVTSDEDAGTCAIVFISAGQEAMLPLAQLGLRGVLTVGDTDRFESDGGMIRFVPARNRLRLRINLNAVAKGSLHISSDLLRIAETKPST